MLGLEGCFLEYLQTFLSYQYLCVNGVHYVYSKFIVFILKPVYVSGMCYLNIDLN